jgi:malonate transporter
MNIGGLIGALLPVFFVLVLGYFAGKRHSFDADQAAGFLTHALAITVPTMLWLSS